MKSSCTFCRAQLAVLSVATVAVLAVLLFRNAAESATPEVAIGPGNHTGIFHLDEPITWQLAARGTGSDAIQSADYVFKRCGALAVGQGTLQFDGGRATLCATLNEPGSMLAEITARTVGGKEIKTFGGAVVAPEKIKPSAPCPADFDAFWKAKLAELALVPPHPVLTSCDSEKRGVQYWKLTLDNIRGTKIRGQLARPERGQKFPALLLMQYAGLYPLVKYNVTSAAREGWLALNISAHDLPIDEAQAFYDQQNNGALARHTAIGNDNREQSYFLRMFLACHRAVDYLSSRPDWNGKVLVVSGRSQGGLQAFVSAALNPKVSAVLALVPAGCDNTGELAGRHPGWPYWMTQTSGKDPLQMLETSTYFDGINFAARVRCPALIGMGLIDTSSPVCGIWSAVNQMPGPKEIVVLPLSDHSGQGNTQAPYHVREKAWRAALLHDQPPPVK